MKMKGTYTIIIQEKINGDVYPKSLLFTIPDWFHWCQLRPLNVWPNMGKDISCVMMKAVARDSVPMKAVARDHRISLVNCLTQISSCTWIPKHRWDFVLKNPQGNKRGVVANLSLWAVNTISICSTAIESRRFCANHFKLHPTHATFECLVSVVAIDVDSPTKSVITDAKTKSAVDQNPIADHNIIPIELRAFD